MALFKIAVTDGGDNVVRLEVAGEIDMSTAPQLLDAVACTAETHDRHNIVVDLQDVSFIDSVGLNTLVRADRCVRTFNAHLVVSNPSKLIQHMFEVTGLDAQLDVRSGWAATGLSQHVLS